MSPHLRLHSQNVFLLYISETNTFRHLRKLLRLDSALPWDKLDFFFRSSRQAIIWIETWVVRIIIDAENESSSEEKEGKTIKIWGGKETSQARSLRMNKYKCQRLNAFWTMHNKTPSLIYCPTARKHQDPFPWSSGASRNDSAASAISQTPWIIYPFCTYWIKKTIRPILYCQTILGHVTL